MEPGFPCPRCGARAGYPCGHGENLTYERNPVVYKDLAKSKGRQKYDPARRNIPKGKPRNRRVGIDTTDLLIEISAFLAIFEIKKTHFGREALKDPGFVGRLQAGANVLEETAEKARAYMRVERQKREASSDE